MLCASTEQSFVVVGWKKWRIVTGASNREIEMAAVFFVDVLLRCHENTLTEEGLVDLLAVGLGNQHFEIGIPGERNW